MKVARHILQFFPSRESKQDRQGKIDSALKMILIYEMKERPYLRAQWGYKGNDAVRNAAVLRASQGCGQGDCHVAEFSRGQIFQVFGIGVRKGYKFTRAVGNLKNGFLS